MSDQAIYVEFTERENGTEVWATAGYQGLVIARLTWERRLSQPEQAEIAAAIRLGARR